MSEQQEIDDYRRVEAFLADPAVKAAISRANESIFAEFKNAKTSVEMETAWAKSKALDTIAGELMRTMGAGQIALAQRTQREEQEARQRAATERRNGSKR